MSNKDYRQEFIAQVTDNTAKADDYQNLGIFKFARGFFPRIFNYDFAMVHYELMQTYFSLLDPRKTAATERQAYFVVHREAAKTTCGTFLIPIYNIFLKGKRIKLRGATFGYHKDDPDYDKIFDITLDEKFILIVSETGNSAEMFVSELKEKIEESKALSQIFGEKHPQYIINEERGKSSKWSKNLFITADDTVVLGLGVGMQVRGRRFRSSRPTLIIADDIYSENTTKTEESIKKIENWVYKALLNSLNSNAGKAWISGTILHPETVTAKVIKDYAWQGIQRPIISLEELNRAKELLVKNDALGNGKIYTPEIKDLLIREEKNYHTLSWPIFHPLFKVMQKYDNAFVNSRLDSFYQEYMNIPLPPEDQWIDENTFLKSDIKSYIKNNVQHVTFSYNGAIWSGELKLNIGIDLGSALSTKSNDTVLTVVGYAIVYPNIPGVDYQSTVSSDKYRNGIVFPVIMEVSCGKMDLFDYEKEFNININKNEKADLQIGNILIDYCHRYNIEMIKAEANGQQGTALRSIRAFLRSKNINNRFWEEYINQDKKEKIVSTIKPIINKHKKVLIASNAWPYIPQIYSQLLTVGMPGTKDDIIDSITIGFKGMKEPDIRSIQNYTTVYKEKIPSRIDRLKKLHGNDYWMYL